MKLDQLKIFVEVAKWGHVTKAAGALGMSQSAISSAIATLEGNYEVRLFDRVGRGIRLTDNGEIFLREARAVLDRAELAKSVLQDFSGHPSPVTIAASQTIAAYWLPRRLASFHTANPRVRLNVVIGNTNKVEIDVVSGKANIGLVEGPTQNPALVRQKIDHDQIILVVASNQPPLPRDKKGGLDLRAINWVLREPGSGTRRAFEDFVLREGHSVDELNVFLVLPSNEAIREAVEAGIGATVISRHVVAPAIAAGKLKEIAIDLPWREYVLVRHRERHATPEEKALAEALLENS